MCEPDANFNKQRRLIAYAPILQPACVVSDLHGSVFSRGPTGPGGLSLGAHDRREARCVTEVE